MTEQLDFSALWPHWPELLAGLWVTIQLTVMATVGGLGIVLLAIILDRITQAMGQPQRGVRHWWQTGPAGMVGRLLSPQKRKDEKDEN